MFRICVFRNMCGNQSPWEGLNKSTEGYSGYLRPQTANQFPKLLYVSWWRINPRGSVLCRISVSWFFLCVSASERFLSATVVRSLHVLGSLKDSREVKLAWFCFQLSGACVACVQWKPVGYWYTFLWGSAVWWRSERNKAYLLFRALLFKHKNTVVW